MKLDGRQVGECCGQFQTSLDDAVPTPFKSAESSQFSISHLKSSSLIRDTVSSNCTMGNCQEKEFEMIPFVDVNSICCSQEETDETECNECSDVLACYNHGEIWALHWWDVNSKIRLLSSQLFTLNSLVYEFLYGEKDWNCLTEELTMFQDNVHLWISDEQTIDRLNVAIQIVKDAYLCLLTKHDPFVYDNFSGIMEQVNVLMDFFQTAEPPQPCQREIMKSIKLAWEKPDPNQSCFEEYVLPVSLPVS
jgi:hypothetical protein